MRNLGSNQIIAKFEGHSAAISNIKFSQKTYEFVSSAGSEFLLWDDHTKSEDKSMNNVVQPIKILDLESSSHISSIDIFEVMKGAFFVQATSDKQMFVFMAKMKSSSKKSKVKKPDSIFSTSENNHEIIFSKFLNQQTIQVVYGNMFSILKRDVEMFEEIKGSGPRIVPTVSLEGVGEKQTK